VGFLQVGSDPAHRSALQRDLVQKFPNVTSIDVRAVVDSIRAILDKITLGITVVGAITLGAGILILAGAVAMTKFQRLYEAAIYRTLGAGTRVLTAMVAGAFGLSWALVEYLFEMRWRPVPGMLAVGALLTAVVVCVVGLAASVDVLMRKPLGTLRRE
jgi:putative ABC transport system permease protein